MSHQRLHPSSSLKVGASSSGTLQHPTLHSFDSSKLIQARERNAIVFETGLKCRSSGTNSLTYNVINNEKLYADTDCKSKETKMITTPGRI